MARYQVPQFLEVEDKIFGPFTFKQFLYAGGGIGIGFLLWTILPKVIAVLIGGPIVAFFMALAFWKVNERPFIFIVESMVQYVFSKKLYLWKKAEKDPKKKDQDIQKNPIITVPKVSESRLSSLSWELDIHESLKGPQEGIPTQNSSKIEDEFKY